MSGAKKQDAVADVLLFEIGGQRYGADASQVLRIDRPDGTAISVTALGRVAEVARALVFKTPEGEGQLKVDRVFGIKQVQVSSLRRLPAAVASEPYAIGVWLDGQRPVLLIDLLETQKTNGRL